MTERKDIFNSLKKKMEEVGFQFEKEQKSHLQKRRETELKFIHPELIKKLEDDGFKITARKYYIKPLSDDLDSEIGFVTGKSSPIYSSSIFSKPNSFDSFDRTLAWTNRDGDVSLDNLLNSIKDYLDNENDFSSQRANSFLFAWNPNRWERTDLNDCIDQLENVGYVERRWSCGNSKSIKKGDRVFLMRLNEEPRGIMGSGFAKSSYYVAPHWDGTKGKTSNYIDIEFDILINPSKDVLFDKSLLNNIDPENVQQWFPQQSGISIKAEVIEALESNWFDFITANKYIKNSFISNDVLTSFKKTFREGKSKDIIQTRYERNPEARKRCLKHYGYSCKVCTFNFENHFGEVGKGFIHVHHINQISEMGGEYEIDPVKDLIPVCPNCHSMINSKRPAFTIEELNEIRNKNIQNGLI